MRDIKIVHFASDKTEFAKIEKALHNIDGTELLAQFTSNVQQAKDFVFVHKPSVVLADIDTPKGILFVNMIKHIKHINIVALVTKSTSQFEAAISSNLSYIEKPVTAALMKKMIAGVFDFGEIKPENDDQHSEINFALTQYAQINSEKKYPARIFISKTNNTKVLHIKDIVYITSNGTCSEFTTIDGETYKVSRLLKFYEEGLNNHPDFARIDQDTIINKNYIRTIQQNKNDIMVEMSNGALLNIARAKREYIYQMLA